MQRARRIVFCGHHGAGKDTAADWMDANCQGLSRGAASSDHLVKVAASRWNLDPAWLKVNRHQYALDLKALGNELRDADPGCLVREAFKTGDVITGLRDIRELAWARAHDYVDQFVWVASDRVATDPTMEYGPEACDVILQNHTTVAAFHATLRRWATFSRFLLWPATRPDG